MFLIDSLHSLKKPVAVTISVDHIWTSLTPPVGLESAFSMRG